MINSTSLLLILSFVGIIIIDVQTIIFLWIVFTFGLSLTYLLNKSHASITLKLYQKLFTIGALYMIACYAFMDYKNFTYLLAYDTIKAFIPNTEFFLSIGNYWDSIMAIWQDYDFFNRFQSGYYTYATTFGYFSMLLNSNFYVGQQISVLFLYPFSGILIFKILNKLSIQETYAYKYAFYISIFSIVFFYSTQVLRDIHVLITYLSSFYILFKDKFSIKNLTLLIFIVFISTTLRIETGLFLIITIPFYIYLGIRNSKKSFAVSIAFLIILFLFSIFSLSNYNYIKLVYNNNQEHYTEEVASSSGVIGTLQKVPIAGDLGSIIYNAIQPLPFWIKLSPSKQDGLGHEVYNIMTFPLVFASFFNLYVIVYILFWLFFLSYRQYTYVRIHPTLKYQLWAGLVFLLLQSAVIAQRRLMGYYCIYYVFFVIIKHSLSIPIKRKINLISIALFIVFQLAATFILYR